MNLLKVFTGKRENPLFNLEIGVDGFQGPFKDPSSFKRIADKFNVAGENYLGSFYVTDSGKLVRGFKEDLHVRLGTVGLDELGKPHIHCNGRGLDYLIVTGKGVFLESIKEYRECGEKLIPYYTLQGLYNSLPNQRMPTKISALKNALKAHAGYEFQSIAARKETRLKLLENKYRELVSNH